LATSSFVASPPSSRGDGGRACARRRCVDTDPRTRSLTDAAHPLRCHRGSHRHRGVRGRRRRARRPVRSAMIASLLLVGAALVLPAILVLTVLFLLGSAVAAIADATATGLVRDAVGEPS